MIFNYITITIIIIIIITRNWEKD